MPHCQQRHRQPMSLISREPFKTLSQILAFAQLLFVRLPWWIIRYSLPFMRPRPTFTLNRMIVANVFRYFSSRSTDIFLADPAKVQTPRDENGVSKVWIDGVPNLITGEIHKRAEEAKITTARIPGYWMHKSGNGPITINPGEKASEGERVVYHLHGGAFVALSAHPKHPPANIPRGILMHSTKINRALSLEFRGASAYPLPVANSFPAALIDVIAGYNYLVNVLNFSASNIIVSGDSAGGNLAIALVRYIISSGLEELPIPGALLLSSPWVALGDSHNPSDPNSSAKKFSSLDIIPHVMTRPWQYVFRAYLGPTRDPSELLTNVYISPASLHLSSGHFHRFPSSLVIAGDAELLYDQIQTLVRRMREDVDGDGDGDGEEGVKEGMGKIVYYESKDSVHDYLSLGSLHEPEYTETLHVIADWIAGL